MHPDPSLRTTCRRSTKLRVDALPQQRPVPPRADREQRVADRKIVAVAGDAELAHLADPARVFLALGVAVLAVGAATALTTLLSPYSASVPFGVYCLAVMLAASAGGDGCPGPAAPRSADVPDAPSRGTDRSDW